MAEPEMRVNVTPSGVLHLVKDGWHVLAMMGLFIWSVSSYKANVENHLNAIDDHLHTIDLHMQQQDRHMELEDQQMQWIVNRMLHPKDSTHFPESLLEKQPISNSFYNRPSLTAEHGPMETGIPASYVP